MFKFKNYDFKRYNYALLVIITILSIIGSFLIKQVEAEGENLFMKQVAGFCAALIMVVVISLIDYHFISKFYIVLYLFNLVLLILVKVVGVTINYAQRWLDLGFMLFQPSELTKIIIIIFFAKLFTVFQHRINHALFLVISLISMGIPTYLILTQTDLSTSIVLSLIFLSILFCAGLSWKIILPVVIIGIPSFVGIFWYVQQDYQTLLSPYQQERILSILNPEEYPELMYQQDNSVQAIGSGQLLGKRLTVGAEGFRGYRKVPISESDFIFSVAGEELGFIGSCIILVLFLLVVLLCLNTARRAADRLGMLIAVGIASWFAFQVFVNIGVATRLLPNTGIPLPFLSSGLSSLMSSMIAIGIIMNISLQPKKAGSRSDF
jgi:rod shape determining protein RodA